MVNWKFNSFPAVFARTAEREKDVNVSTDGSHKMLLNTGNSLKMFFSHCCMRLEIGTMTSQFWSYILTDLHKGRGGKKNKKKKKPRAVGTELVLTQALHSLCGGYYKVLASYSSVLCLWEESLNWCTEWLHFMCLLLIIRLRRLKIVCISVWMLYVMHAEREFRMKIACMHKQYLLQAVAFL